MSPKAERGFVQTSTAIAHPTLAIPLEDWK